jgi:hypothetical protein
VNNENAVELDAIPDKPKRKYTKRAKKWGHTKAGIPILKGAKRGVKRTRQAKAPVRLAFSLGGKNLELELAAAMELYKILHIVFGEKK